MKWYEKKWFMWAALVFFAPLGWFLLYCHRHEFTKKQLYAIAGISAVWFIFAVGDPLVNPPKDTMTASQKADLANEQAEKEIAKQMPNKKQDNQEQRQEKNYMKPAEEAIERYLVVPVVSIGLMDYWQMEHPESNLADVKGTFELDGKEHTFHARFVMSTEQLVLLHIDDKRVMFDDETQTKVMDEAMAKEKENK